LINELRITKTVKYKERLHQNKTENMKSNFKIGMSILVLIFCLGCSSKSNKKTIKEEMTAAKILGNPDYEAISYGGYRQKSRDKQPTIAEIKDRMKIFYAMGITIVRT
jgi:hypothetical protein